MGISVATKAQLLWHAQLSLKLAKLVADPDLAASLVQRAADLKEQADNLDERDDDPCPPDVED